MKVTYNDINFDSELEVDYFKNLVEMQSRYLVERIMYHPTTPFMINGGKYTPDFIVKYNTGVVEIIETKGYNQFSFMRDNMIHNYMKYLPEEELKSFCIANGFDDGIKYEYKKIKYLKSFGFVEWDFKNPNTLANKRKIKLNEQESELKELKNENARLKRYIEYSFKDKLTKAQREWKNDFIKEWKNEKSNND